MNEKYALKLEYENGVTLCIWRCEDLDNYSFVAEYPVNLQDLTNLMYNKYKSLIADNDWVYMTKRQVNFLLTKMGHEHLPEHKCKTCEKHTEGYIPFLQFYTGCPDCNPEDRGKYTLKEVMEKAQNH